MSQTTTMLKLGITDLTLDLLESGASMRDFTLENPIRAIRQISRDMTGRVPVRLANGRTMSALDMQQEYLERVTRFATEFGRLDDPDSVASRSVELWGRGLKAVESGDFTLIDTEIDWAIKLKLLERYMNKHDLKLDSPRIAQLDLTYHDISRSRGVFYMLERAGQAATVVRELDSFRAKSVPPQTTRAKLRGDFVGAAQDNGRDFTVDWVHLKLNDQTPRTVLCKDPFSSVDERVDRLIESMS